MEKFSFEELAAIVASGNTVQDEEEDVIFPVATFACLGAYACEYREEHPVQEGFIHALEQKSERDFFKHLRVTRSSYENILKNIENAYGPRAPGIAFSIGLKRSLYLTLWYLATSSTFREISELFGLSEGVTYDAIQQVIAMLCTLSRKFIRWPSLQEAVEIERSFLELAGMPGVIGAVDGCHISIKAPENVQADYLDRTMRHMVNLIAVCTAKKTFSYIQAGFPGSAHDSRVFHSTEVFSKMENEPGAWFPSDSYHIVGDSAFALHKHLLVPYKNTGRLSEAQIKFNKRLSRIRVVIENTFALLKGRFRRLKYIDADIQRIPKIIKACCVLHNASMTFPDENFLIEEGVVQVDEAHDNTRMPSQDSDSNAEEKRRYLASLF